MLNSAEVDAFPESLADGTRRLPGTNGSAEAVLLLLLTSRFVLCAQLKRHLP